MPEPPDGLAAALITLQAKLPRITKDDEAQVGTRTYSYANLATIHDAVMPLLCELGLTWTCRPTLLDSGAFVLAYSLRHAASGEQETGDYPCMGMGRGSAPKRVRVLTGARCVSWMTVPEVRL